MDLSEGKNEMQRDREREMEITRNQQFYFGSEAIVVSFRNCSCGMPSFFHIDFITALADTLIVYINIQKDYNYALYNKLWTNVIQLRFSNLN